MRRLWLYLELGEASRLTRAGWFAAGFAVGVLVTVALTR